MSFIQNLELHQKEALREHLLGDFKAFSKFAFKLQTGAEFIMVDFYDPMFRAIQMLIDHRSSRMIINIPPRAGKTQVISIFLPLFAWCHSPHGQNILTSFNSSVLADSAGTIRTIMNDPDFRAIFPDVDIDLKKQSVEKLGTMSGGVTHAIVSSGSMTGKGAGTLSDEFSGILCIDDIIKPDMAMSQVERDKINFRYSNTILSRLATEETPLVVIMQRLSKFDLCSYILEGKADDNIYDWLSIPGIITKDTGSAEWYQKQIDDFGYVNAKPILYDLKRDPKEFDSSGESSFWSRRKRLDTLQSMRTKDPYTFYTQYQQIPFTVGSQVITEEDIRTWVHLEKRDIQRTFMVGDTAGTAQSYSDYSVFLFAALMKSGDLYVLDMLRGKWEYPELIIEIRDYWKKHSVFDMNAPNMCPKKLHIEEKSSGLFVNQQLAREGGFPLEPIPRDGTGNNDKFSRFLASVPYYKQGKVFLPKEHEGYLDMKREIVGMNEFGNDAGHDDIVDTLTDACTLAFSSAPAMDYTNWNNDKT